MKELSLDIKEDEVVASVAKLAFEISLGAATIEGVNWKYFSNNQYSTTSFASIIVMGNADYPFDNNSMSEEIEKLFSENIGKGGYSPYLAYNFIFYVDIGTVEVSASREDIQYTDFTKKNLVKLLGGFFSELVEKINAKIENAANIFEAKRLFHETFCNLFSTGNSFNFLGKKCNWKGFDVSDSNVVFHFSQDENLPDGHEPANIRRYSLGGRSRKSVHFYLETKLSSDENCLNVINDCNGKHLKKRMTEVIVNKNSHKVVNFVTVRDQELWKKALAKRGLEGYAFKKLSEIEIPTIQQVTISGNPVPTIRNKKHLKHAFVLDLNKNTVFSINSNYWVPVVVDINCDAGVWMEINRFECKADPAIDNKRLIDEINGFCSSVGISAPIFFGFKKLPNGIDKNPNFIELKAWICQTIINKLKADNSVDDFVSFLHICDNLINSSVESLIRCLRNAIELNDSVEIQDLIESCNQAKLIYSNKVFREFRQILVTINFLSKFREGFKSNSRHSFYDKTEVFMQRNPLIQYINESFYSYLNSPTFNKSLISYVKLSREHPVHH